MVFSNLDPAAVGRDDAVADSQTEPCAAAGGLGRVKRVEDLADDGGGNAGAGVGDFDSHIRAGVVGADQNVGSTESGVWRG